ncbi:glycosyltransferase family 2 protein [Flavobacterium sp.]|uniref:glycosyltransferase family 2 protein n=1 Tax=Flavobacterium sp. TaxID=239 RepID=UPI00286A268F|nr:glycosyltransferase family 2 protein [Flavobacterium sp.]
MSKLSIITINYNNASGLQRTIESVAAQQYSDMEYIVVDGGSTDESLEIIKQHEKFINKWVSEKDNGIYNALNKGIKMATGNYLLFLNSGDHFYDSAVLNKYHHHIEKEDLIAFDIHFFGPGYNKIGKHIDNLNFTFLFEDTFAHQSIFIRRNLFDKVGLYDETLKIVADWKFFIHAIVFHRSTYKAVHEVLSTYYLDGISGSPEGVILRNKERKTILKNDFSLFYDDYINAKKNRKLLAMNRFVMLQQLEKSYLGRKCSSLVLKFMTQFS